MMIGKTFLNISICSVLGLSAMATSTEALSATGSDLTRPNILVIMTDDEDMKNLGAYGGNVDTPYRDSIANNGILFENANAVTTVCSPARYSFFTGRHYDTSYDEEFLHKYPEGTAANLINDSSLEKDGTNLAAILQANEYNTAHIGKWHLSNHAALGMKGKVKWEQMGLKSYSEKSNPATDSETNEKLAHNHAYWQKEIAQFGFDFVDGVYAANAKQLFNKYLFNNNVEWTGDIAVNYLDSQKAEKNPFFLYMSTTYAHGPKPDWERKGKFPFSFDADPALTAKGKLEGDFSERKAYRQALKNDPKYDKMDKVARSAKWWDNEVGRVIKKLKETGQYENTIIVYLSDHNAANNQKASLYGGGVEIPMLMQWPAKLKTPMVYKELASSIDIMPTLLDVTKAKLPKQMKPMYGKSFAKLFGGDNSAYRDSLLLKLGNAVGIKTNDWKYIALRYPAKQENMMMKGDATWNGFKDSKIPQPYQFGHTQLTARVFSTHPNYFQRNQLFKDSDIYDENNLYQKSPEVALTMKEVLTKELKDTERPYGEFFGNADISAWKHVENAIWYPESSKDVVGISTRKR